MAKTNLETLQGWGGEQDAFKVASAEPAGTGAWSAKLTTTALSGNPGLEIVVRKTQNDDRFWIQLQRPVPRDAMKSPGVQELRRMTEDVGLARHGTTLCALVEDPDAPHIEIRTVVYSDGLTRDGLNQRVCDVAKAARAIEERIGMMAESARMMAETERLLKDDEALVARFESEMEQRGSAARSIAAAVREAESKAEVLPSAPGTCAACGASNPAGSRFCGSCGKALGCPSCGAANAPGMRFCVKCGTEFVKAAR